MELEKAIKSRKSVKKFLNEKPDWRDILEAIDAVRYAPMAGNCFNLKFIVVDVLEKIEKIALACQQDFVSQARYLVVVTSDPKILVNCYGEKEGKRYNKQQAGAAIENFLLKITESGLSTCWVGYFAEEQIKRCLKIPDNVDVEAVFPIGYEFGKPLTKKMKIELHAVLRFNDYKTKKMNPEKKINV